ncbi:MAG: hypothetical protein O3A46_16050, partial [Candidatus Poribacteria bacterium]|nr:hypothetical protein [Candidatus Poribacteria bacterium]
GEYSLERYLRWFRCPQARERFRCVRAAILEAGDFKEAYRKDYIAFVDRGRYNRFLLFPQRRNFRLATQEIRTEAIILSNGSRLTLKEGLLEALRNDCTAVEYEILRNYLDERLPDA